MPEVPVVPAGTKPPVFKHGQIVRVSRNDSHGVRFGCLMMVDNSGLLPFEGWAEEVVVVPLAGVSDYDSGGAIHPDFGQSQQAVWAADCKLAKQATAKALAYANKRG